MKKILVVAGGSGPVNLLNGLHEACGKFAKIQVLINALDNGLSTGQCRQIFNGKLLGPSDVRKNALVRYAQIHGRTELLDFLNVRFKSTSEIAEQYVLTMLDAIKLEDSKKNIIREAVVEFFKQPLARTIDYNDFSISNMVYSGIASKFTKLSLLEASRFFSKNVLEIEEDFVLLNSEAPVFLNAETTTGKVLTDEVDIDEWDNPSDPIDSIFYTDSFGVKQDWPDLHPDAKQAILDADLIILSSGTQWTSLIPTYATKGFSEAFAQSSAEKYLIMNCTQDTDMTGIDSAKLLDCVDKYLPIADLTVFYNTAAEPFMQIENTKVKKSIHAALSRNNEFSSGADKFATQHDKNMLANAVMKEFMLADFDHMLNSKSCLVFDYDDTLVGRNDTFTEASTFNIRAVRNIGMNYAIVTGNTIKSIAPIASGTTVFADNAVNEYFAVTTQNAGNYENSKRFRYSLKNSFDAYKFTQTEIDAIVKIITEDIGIDASKIVNKGFAGIGIKPVIPEYRKAVAALLQVYLNYEGLQGITAKVSGRTSIDIFKSGVNKNKAIEKLLTRYDNIVYFGDEWESGNDASIYELSKNNERIKFIKVEDPTDVALLMTTFNNTALQWNS